MDPTPLPASLRTVLIAVAAVLALVGAGGLVTGAADEGDDLTSAGSTSDTTLGVTDSTLGDGAATTGTTVAGAPGTTAKSATATTRPAGASPTTVPTVESNACSGGNAGGSPAANVTAPAVGIYTYVGCDDPTVSREDAVRDGGSESGKVRRRITRSEQGINITETRAYGSAGVFEEALDIASPFGNIRCDLEPDVLIIPAGLTNGKAWSGEGSCTTPQAGKITIKGSGKVTGARKVNVGGTSIDAWVVEANLSLQYAGQKQESDQVLYIDPARGIDLYRKVTAKDSEGNTFSASLRLASLSPKPV